MIEDKVTNLLSNITFLVEQNSIQFPDRALELILKGEKQLTVHELLLVSEMSGQPVHVLLNHRLDTRFSGIKMLIMDCDGVLTDGGMILTKNGDEIKKFNAKDGQGIKRAHNAGIITGIISAGKSTGLVERRAEMLGIEHVYVGKQPKLEVLMEWLEKLKLGFEDIAYIGDDISDIEILQRAAISACPADAVMQVREVSGLILRSNGGDGCVRELIDEYLLVE
jgi:3-deoxy-D-manno-octulosonate 8-phosphate phosphatase (KDO 8-P phosphatase)